MTDPRYILGVTTADPSPDHEGADAPDAELRAPAVRESVGIARQMLLALGEHVGFDDERNGDMAVAAGEACNNVVNHAYGGDGSGPLTVAAWVRSGALEVVVRDEGAGFVPAYSDDSRGLGLGLPLMIAIADAVTFGRSPAGENEVRLRFEVEPSR